MTILDDQQVEGDETLNLGLSNPTGGAVLGSPSAAVLTISDNDMASSGTLQLSSATYSTGEAGGTLDITVSRAGGSSGAVSVDYASSNGTATAGADYTAVGGTLNWADGNTTSQTFSVTILEDADVESNETFGVALSKRHRRCQPWQPGECGGYHCRQRFFPARRSFPVLSGLFCGRGRRLGNNFGQSREWGRRAGIR